MVVFTCGHCGEAVNKPKVEKHYLTKCRNRPANLSCMDCLKDFFGKDYEAHTKCISEAQRYAAKGFVPKINKGEAKQSAWVEMVHVVLEEQKNAPRHVLRIVEEISKYTNTPRKKPKFINFVKNICGHRTMPKDIDAAWDLISVKLSSLSKANDQNDKQNGVDKKDNMNGITSDAAEMKEMPKVFETLVEKMVENSDTEEKTEIEVMTKKQRKEEKKRRKYEAELQSAAVQPTEETITDKTVKDDANKIKKDKKRKKTKQENASDNAEEEKVKKMAKKRKNSDQNEEKTANIEINQPSEQNGGKYKKKKRKTTEEVQENEELPNLHDQNVASEEPTKVKGDKFDWEGMIVSLLQKKGGEMPFKRLQKRVLAEYMEVTGKETDDRIAEKLNKKLRSVTNVRVEKNRVLLVN